jgi:hypothetical protein
MQPGISFLRLEGTIGSLGLLIQIRRIDKLRNTDDVVWATANGPKVNSMLITPAYTLSFENRYCDVALF